MKHELNLQQILLRHGAGGSDFAKLLSSQQNRRKGALPLFFQAAAGGHIKVKHGRFKVRKY